MSTIIEHIAIIMDGNRRWAKERGLPPQFGHREGANNLERVAVECEKLGIKYLTVFAFSTENWKRSKEEVDYLMELLAKTINDFDKKIATKNMRLRLAGDITGLPPKLQKGITEVQERTKSNKGLTLNIAINYGGRAEMVHVAKLLCEDAVNKKLKIEDIKEEDVNKRLYTFDSPDPDLMVRTGGEKRLSGFLIWQTAYTEYYFTDTYWPAFDKKELDKALEEYNSRKRNFGA